MAIAKTIYQTYKTNKLPFLIRWYISKMKKKNPNYDYQFYDDKRIDDFFKNEYEEDIYNLYKKINIGAAKADFFRYAILYKKGGIYLDIDSANLKPLDTFILPDDNAIISLEGHKTCYAQWALIFEAGHPFLKKTLELLIDNLKTNKYPFDVHQMTGPSVFTRAIKICIAEDNSIPYREIGIDYNNNFQFSFPLSKLFLYGIFRTNHWKKQSVNQPLMKVSIEN